MDGVGHPWGRRRHDGPMTRIIAGRAGGRRIAVPPAGHPADVGPGARGAVQRADRGPRPGRRRGARPVRRVGGARAGGALAGRRARAVRRGGPAGRRGAAPQRRRCRSPGRRGARRVRRGRARRTRRPALRRACSSIRPTPCRTPRWQGGSPPPSAHGWLADDAMVVVERGRGAAFPWPAPLHALRERRYGDTSCTSVPWRRAWRMTQATIDTARPRRGTRPRP